MSAARAVKESARIATAAGPAKNLVGFLDKRSSSLPERVMPSRELRIICDRLRHTLDLIPLSAAENHPKLFRVRQNILEQMEVLNSIIVEAAKEDEKPASEGLRR